MRVTTQALSTSRSLHDDWGKESQALTAPPSTQIFELVPANVNAEGNLSKQDLMYIYQSAILILVTKALSGAADAERRERSQREQKAMIDQDY